MGQPDIPPSKEGHPPSGETGAVKPEGAKDPEECKATADTEEMSGNGLLPNDDATSTASPSEGEKGNSQDVLLQTGPYGTQVKGIYIAKHSGPILEEGRKAASFAPPPTPSFQEWSPKTELHFDSSLFQSRSLVTTCEKLLSQRRFIVLTCTQEVVARSMAPALAQVVTTERRLYLTQFGIKNISKDRDRMSLTLASFVDQLERKTAGSLIYCNIDALPMLDAQGIIEELRRFNTDSSCQHITAALATENQTCIFFVAHKGQPDDPQFQFGDSVCLDLADEQELLVVSAARECGITDNSIIQRLRNQLTTNINGRTVWGSSHGERFQALLNSIRAKNIITTVARFDEDTHDLAEAEIRYERKLSSLCGLDELPAIIGSHVNGDASNAIKPAIEEICKYALFMNTAFKDVTAGEFDWLMNAFLRNRIYIHKQKERRPRFAKPSSSQSELSHVQEVPIEEWVETETQVSLVDLYRRLGDTLLTMIEVGKSDGERLNFMPANKRHVASSFVQQRLPLLCNYLISEVSISQAMLFHAPAESRGANRRCVCRLFNCAGGIEPSVNSDCLDGIYDIWRIGPREQQ